MKDLKLNTAPGPEPEPPKPEPVVFLEETKFDDENGNDYSIAVDEKNGVIVYSECCADVMTPETALKVYHAIGNYLMALNARTGN
jgi:hypothetical protein